MCGMKIPPQDFALKMQGGLWARGGVFAGHYGIYLEFSHLPLQKRKGCFDPIWLPQFPISLL